MGFYDHCAAYRDGDVYRKIRSVTDGDVRRVLDKHTLSPDEYLSLLSPAATAHLERMAQTVEDNLNAQEKAAVALERIAAALEAAGETATGDETAAGDERVGFERLERMDDGTLRSWVSADPMTLEQFDDGLRVALVQQDAGQPCPSDALQFLVCIAFEQFLQRIDRILVPILVHV